MSKSGTKVPETEIIVPLQLRDDGARLRRDLEAAVDAIVPLLAQIDPINERVCDVAVVLDRDPDGDDSSDETLSEVQRLASVEGLDHVVQRLLAAIPKSISDLADVGELQVVKFTG